MVQMLPVMLPSPYVSPPGKHDFHVACWYSSAGAGYGRRVREFGVATSGARVGERLRAIRRQKGLSLHDVEARSNLEFKASVLGAYERGERAISVPRLLRLSEIYEVPGDQLLPRDSESEINLADAGGTASLSLDTGYTIDLTRLSDVDDPDAAILSRYARTIQLQRQDFNGKMLTIRRDDLRVLAAVLDRQVEELGMRFDQLGLRAST
jgi:transcriptional regulator with XRE-family HTH domain